MIKEMWVRSKTQSRENACVRLRDAKLQTSSLRASGFLQSRGFACVRKSGRKVEVYRVCDRRTQPYIYSIYRFCALRLTRVTGEVRRLKLTPPNLSSPNVTKINFKSFKKGSVK